MTEKLNKQNLDKRLALLRKDMKESGLDGVILINPANIYYYSGFYGEDSWLLIGLKECSLITDGRYTAQAALECPQCLVLCQNSTSKWAELLRQSCHTWQIKKLGFEDSIFTYEHYRLMRKALTDVDLFAIGELACAHRQIKDEDEIECLAKAAAIGDAALFQIEAYLRAGITEAELARELNYAMYKKGAQDLAFPTIAAAGKNGAKPHAKPNDYQLQNGDLVTLDFGAVYKGYHGDITRTLAIGSVSAKIREIYTLVQEAQEYAISAIHAGMTCGEADALARNIFEDAGFAEHFSHSLGHGTGLEIHEMPWLRKNNDAVLQVGHVVTVEPGLYFPEWGGIRIEDTVVITEKGAVALNKYPKDLLIF